MKTFQEFILECYELEESSSYVILEVRRPESGSPEEKARWDRQKERQDALDNPSSMIIGIIGRDKKGIQQYGLKDAERRRQQRRNRSSRLKDIDSDLDPDLKKRGDRKASLIGSGNRNASPPIKGRGKEVHHGTSIADSDKELKDLNPEQRIAKKKKDAQGGKFHGSHPGNLIQTDGPKGGTGIPHRGEGGYHSRQKPVGKGGSIQDFGSEKEIVAQQRSTQSSIRRTRMTHQERLAKELGIETPTMKKRRKLRERMKKSPVGREGGEVSRLSQKADEVLRDLRSNK
jgi:hypothetical protein